MAGRTRRSYRSRSAATRIPTRSIPTSSAVPDRPSTKLWWYSSTIAYRSEIAAAIGSARRVRGRSAQNHSSASAPKTKAWPSLRRIRSQIPRPVSRSGWDESQKIRAMRASGAGARLAIEASELTLRIVVV